MSNSPIPRRHADADHTTLVQAARVIHKFHGRAGFHHQVDLPAVLTARILGRTLPPNLQEPFWILLCNADTDEVWWGNHLVWKTGGKAVYQYVLDQVSEADLTKRDLAITLLWYRHEWQQVQEGRPPITKYRPTYWRLGQQLETPPWQSQPAAELTPWIEEVAQHQAAVAPFVTAETLSAEAVYA
jgi:hypothetical protein